MFLILICIVIDALLADLQNTISPSGSGYGSLNGSGGGIHNSSGGSRSDYATINTRVERNVIQPPSQARPLSVSSEFNAAYTFIMHLHLLNIVFFSLHQLITVELMI